MRDRALGSTIRLKFTTTDSNGAPVAPSSAFAASDFRIYKDGSATEKATTNGITVTSPFDSVTGRHLIEIDTSNSTGDTGFWASGSAYFVELNTAKTVNGQSVSGLEVGSFSLELQTADVRKNGGVAITQSSGRQEVNVTHFGGTAGTFSSGRPEVDTTHWGGTAVGSVTINCNMTQISGDSGAADNAESFFDGTGYAGTNNVIPTVSTVSNRVTANTDQWNGVAVTGMPMPTYTQPTGFLAATFPTTVASPTNITSLPAVTLAASQPNYAPLTTLGTNAPAGWINAAAIAADAINASKLAADAVAEIADGVWDEDMSGHTGSTTYGGRIVRATNSNVTVQITGSNHIAADIHGCQPDGLTDSTEIAAINTLATRLTTMIEVDGLVYRYTTNALEQAPAGGGGGGTDWTADERTAIRTILGIPGSGTTPADPSDGVLYDIKQKTDQIGSAGAITNLLAGAVLDPGTITSFPSELVIGDSYQETDGREIQIPLVDTDGNVLTTVGSRNLADATATFEIRRINESDSTRVITGVATIVDPPGTGTGAGAPYAIVELPADETAKGLVSYRYRGKLTLTWSGPGTDVYSFDTETIKFTY